MQSIPRNVTGSQALESARPHLEVVPKPRPFFARARSVRTASSTDKLIFLTLATYANPETGECWPSLNTLCADTQYSRRSLLRGLTSLERDGHISRQRSTGGRGKSTRYILHVTATALHLTGAACPPNRGTVSTQQGQRVHLNRGSVPPEESVGRANKKSQEREPRTRTREADDVLTPSQKILDTPSLSHTLTCPKCKRSFPVNSKAGDVCFNCCASITVIQRRLDEAGKYKDVPIRIINEDKKVQEQRIDYKEKCVERERIAEAKRVEEQRIEQERRDQEQDPEYQAEQVLKAAEQRRKAQEAHHLRLEALTVKQGERRR